ncbi:nucleotide exchange factor GrpE [Candidatus Falkowbacteria bacterium]|nr:nucleotide exchange factor GrpE [Candidatus Falkowbacteria bacterium]
MADDKQKPEEKNDAAPSELEACKKQAEEYLNGWKRAKADYLNLKKENEAAGAELAQFVAGGMLMKFLPIYDGLKKACAMENSGDKWVEGILNIKKQFEEVFKKFGVEEIKTVGEKFNPEFHEAVSRQKKEGVEVDMIIEEVGGGYTMHGKVILAAKVIVSE